MARRVIALLGKPIINEDGVASAAITPGHLVEGVTSVAKFSTAGGPAPRTFALERDELGDDIDVDYAADDNVKVGSFAPGMRVNALIASGENISEDQWLEPSDDGTLRAQSAGTRIARALEAVDNSAGPSEARIRVEVF